MRILLVFYSLLGTLLSPAQTLVIGGFTHNGIERDYRLYIPASYVPGTAVPLVFNLHGFGIQNHQQEAYADFRPIADTAGFIIAHPNGTLDNGGYRFWNAFGLIEVDDLGFITDLIDTISAHYSIDASRIYSTGMSNGGMMTYELACQRSERFAAVASVTGTMLQDRFAACAPTHPMPVLQIHGTADEIIPFDGGNGMVPVPSILNYWIGWNTASPTPVITTLPDIAPSDGTTVEHHVHAGLVSDVPVELFKVIGGPHSWPGSSSGQPGTNHDINAAVEVWRFLSRFDLQQLSTGTGTASVERTGFLLLQDPGSSSVLLRMAGPGPGRILVHDAGGRLVLEKGTTATDTHFTLDKPGVYAVSLIQAGNRTTRRIIGP